MQYKTNSLGYDLTFVGPDTVEEYNQKAGRPNACLEDAVDNEIYRGTLPEFKEKFVKRLSELTGLTLGTNEENTAKARARAKAAALKAGKTEIEADEAAAKVKASSENETSFNLRVLAAVRKGEVEKKENGVGTGELFTEEELAKIAQEVADGIQINPAPSQRVGPPKKSDLEKADSLLAGDSDTLEGKISVWQTAVPEIEIQRGEDGKPLRDSLARAIGRYLAYKLAQAQAEL